MEITKFIVSSRAQSYGDFSTYHGQLSRRLLKCRKRLGIATKNRGKYSRKGDVTAENIKENKEYVNLLLLTSERAWAQARSMKAARAATAQPITGKARSHIISRMTKASRAADNLALALSDVVVSGASATEALEAYAYAGQIRGAAQFEKQCWEACLRDYSVAYAIYRALMASSDGSGGDVYKELLGDPIETSMQFAAYQLKTPRTVPIEVIARKAFPQTNSFLVREIEKRDPTFLRQSAGQQKSRPGQADDDDDAAATEAPKTLSWRGRQVRIEDAHIAKAWAAAEAAKARLLETFSSADAAAMMPKERAAAYEDVLAASQDAVDATRLAIGALVDEGVPQGDGRMQSLQVTRTAVNYATVSWRVGRNRALLGPHDGADENYVETSKRKAKRKLKEGKQEETEASQTSSQRKVKMSQKVAKLKERVALYEGALQSLEEAMGLPGVPADEELSSRLKAAARYFTALKCLSIARSHTLASSSAESRTNTLALIHHAHKTVEPVVSFLSQGPQPKPDTPPDVTVSGAAVRSLRDLLAAQVTRYRALVHIDRLRAAAKAKHDDEEEEEEGDSDVRRPPLINCLGEYPPGGDVDLDNIVEYPPKPTFVPLKPMLLDLAWNYIDYPRPDGDKPSAKQQSSTAEEEAKPRKGWFGFGR